MTTVADVLCQACTCPAHHVLYGGINTILRKADLRNSSACASLEEHLLQSNLAAFPSSILYTVAQTPLLSLLARLDALWKEGGGAASACQPGAGRAGEPRTCWRGRA